MLRVILSVLACMSLAACGGLPSYQSFGFAGGASDPDITASYDRTSARRNVSGDSADARRSAKAPKGALADRDYTGLALDPLKAEQMINTYRSENGLKPVKLHSKLSYAAKAHARDLARHDRISHYGSDGSNPWDRVRKSGYKPSLAAENVGTGQNTLAEVLAGWKESDAHNKNLLLPQAEHMGIALVDAPDTEFRSFWTLVVGAPM